MSPARAKDDLPDGVLELFQKMVERDQQTRDQLVHSAAQLSSLASAMTSMQGEMQRLVSLGERQEEFNRQQLVLAERSATHAQTFDRAFGEIESVRGDLLGAVRELTGKIEQAASAVLTHQSGVSVLRWVVVTLLPVLCVMIAFVYKVAMERIDDARLDAVTATTRLEQRVDEMDRADDADRAELKAAVRDLQTAEGLR